MEKNNLSRQKLEAMSTGDLLLLADDYGIDIPDNLNRRFIIGEILEASEEFASPKGNDIQVNFSEEDEEFPSTLPKTYNDTKIYAALRNPGWLFVFWDMKESEKETLLEDFSFGGFFLRTLSFDSATAEKCRDSFDIQVSQDSNGQYVLVPSGSKYVMIQLACNVGGDPRILANTRRIQIPQESEAVRSMQPGKKVDVSPLVSLSGMKTLLHDHYVNHRQLFSDR